jgi:transposase
MNVATLPSTLEAAHQLIEQLQWRIRQLEKELFGPSSERQADQNLSKEQILLSLFPPPAQPAATQQVLVRLGQNQSEPRVRRQPAAKVLETVSERIEPEEKLCPHCGQAKGEIGCEKSERFEYVSAKIIRHEIVRPKLACACGQGGVSIAPLPPAVVEQGQPAASLVAHVLLSKYDDHLPLYRQEQQFQRLGVNFPRQSLCDWVEKGAEWLQPIVREIKRELLQRDYLQVDETPVRVMDPEVRGRCATGWLWVLGEPGGDVIFEFHPGRGKEFAKQLLGGFQGRLQRDGYGVYGALARENLGLIPVGCWSHARRKFVDALEERPDDAGGTGDRDPQTVFGRTIRARRVSLARTARETASGTCGADFGRAQTPVGRIVAGLFTTKSLGQSHSLCVGRMGAVDPLSARRAVGDRQQSDRERDSAQRSGQKELAVHRAPAGGLAQCGDLLGDRELSAARD